MTSDHEKLLNLYEVVFWSGSSDGPDGRDAIYLIAAHDHLDAGLIAYCNPFHWNGVGDHPEPDVIYELALGVANPKVASLLRGPYFEHAYNRDWKAWSRDRDTGNWHAQNWCKHCNCDMTFNTSDVCPECGRETKELP